MRFLIAVIDDTARSADSDERAAIDVFNDGLESNGHWVFACGIDGPTTATLIDNRDDAGLVVDGPLLDSTEFVSGMWIIEAESREVARELAIAGSKACNRKVELRPLL
jgi:hypothetical protein